MRTRIRHFWRFLKRLWFWLPILWRDEDWDSAYLYEIMRHKISRIRLDTESNGCHIGKEHDIRNMKVAEHLLKRMANDDFWHYNFQALKDDRCTCKHLDPFAAEYLEPVGDNYRWTFKSCTYCCWLLKNPYQDKEKQDAAYLWDLMKKQSARWWN